MDCDYMFFPLENQLTFCLELKLFTEYTASLYSSKGLCVMAVLRYAFFVILCCVMPFCVMRYAFLRYGFLRYASLRNFSFRDDHLQNRLVAIQLWIDAFMIWTILFQILIIEF